MNSRYFAPTQILRLLSTAFIIGVATSLGGCSQEEKVLDVETPGLDLEVTEDTESGELSVEGELGEN